MTKPAYKHLLHESEDLHCSNVYTLRTLLRAKNLVGAQHLAGQHFHQKLENIQSWFLVFSVTTGIIKLGNKIGVILYAFFVRNSKSITVV